MHAEERELIEVLRTEPDNTEPCLVYEDWLEDRDEPRSQALRVVRALSGLTPDNAAWAVLEERLGELRPSVDPRWLDEMIALLVAPGAGCDCNVYGEWRPTGLHRDVQDTSCDAWKRLVELVEIACGNVTLRFSPLGSIPPNERADLVTLPAAIGDIAHLAGIDVYRSSLVRIPPQIGRLQELREFVPYTSHRLHWFPFEITKCPALRDSTVSTRALYGNAKNEAPFPRLAPPRFDPIVEPVTRPCAVCDEPYADRGEHRAWKSRPVATDVLPLLVNACSEGCLESA